MISDFKRDYGRVTNIPLKELIEKFDLIESIKIALLFGSRASENFTVKSDYDFAVAVDDNADIGWGKMSAVRNEIGKSLSIPDCDFDVIDICTADKNLLASIAECYIVIKGDKDAISRLLE